MGSLRRGLILALLPSAAWAEVCDKERPAWDGAPVTPVTEAVALFSSLPALVLICATLLALRFRHQWGGLIVVLLWSFLISAHVSLDPSGIKAAARDEGCLGDPILFIGLVIAICIATILYTAPLGSRPPHGEN